MFSYTMIITGVKLLLTKNNGASGEQRARVIVSETDTSGYGISLEKRYKEPADCWEIVDGLFNHMTAIHNIR